MSTFLPNSNNSFTSINDSLVQSSLNIPQNPISMDSGLTSMDIRKIAQIFGYNLGGSCQDQLNMIRNRLGFGGVVDRSNFEENELLAILNHFNIPSYLPTLDQMNLLRSKLNSVSSPPSSPENIYARSSMGSPTFSPGSPLQSPIRTRTPHFNLIELQKIASRLGISTLGQEETLIQNIRAEL